MSVDIQVNDGIPVYVTVLQPTARVLEEMRRQQPPAQPFLRPAG